MTTRTGHILDTTIRQLIEDNNTSIGAVSLQGLKDIISIYGYNFMWWIPNDIVVKARDVHNQPLGDGTNHPLWLFYVEEGVNNEQALINAKVDFPNAQTLDDEVPALALQRAIDHVCYSPDALSSKVYAPRGFWHTKELHLGYGFSYFKRSTPYTYVSLTLEGESGTVFSSTVADRPCISIQGGAACILDRFAVVGLNSGIPIGGDYGQGSIIQSNYISPYNTMVASSTSRYAPYTGIAIDPRCSAPAMNTGEAHYPDAYFNPEWFDPSTYTVQFYKNVSSGVKIKNVSVSQFIVGIGIQCNGSQVGNGDFMKFDNVGISQCMFGVSGGDNQMRLTSFTNCQIDQNYIGVCADEHGSQEGRFDLFINCHFSNFMQFRSSSYTWQGPMVFQGGYLESGKMLGKFGNKLSAHNTVHFIGVTWGFGHYQADYVPAVVAEGSAQLIFEGGGMYGRALDMDMSIAPVFKNYRFIIQPDYAYDTRFHVGDNADVYNMAFANHPVVTFEAKHAIYENCNLTVRDGSGATLGSFKLDSRKGKGTSYSDVQPDIHHYGEDGVEYWLEPGKNGIENDFLYKNHGYLNIGGTFDSNTGLWTFPLSALGSGNYSVADLAKVGDYLIAPFNKLVMMIRNIGGGNVTCLLKGGFKLANFNISGYIGINVPDITNNSTNWWWYNNNHYETSPTTATAETIVDEETEETTYKLTGIEYIYGRLGKAANPVDELRVGGLVYIYNYNSSFKVNTSKWHTNKILSKDAETGEVILAYPNPDITGKVTIITGNSTI